MFLREKHAWYNSDLLPTPRDKRTWGVYHYLFFYFTTSLTPSSYTLGSTLVNNGLLYWHALICAVIGSIILSPILVFNSRAPATYHIGYPTAIRAAAGMYGSYFFIFVRISVAVIYFATQTYFAGMLLSVLMRCVFGHKWENIPNHLPASAGVDSKHLLSFFLIWIIQGPLMFLHPSKQRYLYTIKFAVTSTSLFAVFGYCVRKAGGSLGSPEDLGTNRATGSDLVWGVVSGINSIIAALCPILVNSGDIVRYSSKPSDSAWIQSFAVLFSKVLITFLGAGTTSAAATFLGKTFWNPWDLYGALLNQTWTASMRTGMFFASLSLIFALVVVNLGTNCLPVGADATGLFPKYLTIKRGQVLCWLICPALAPFKMISSGTKFLTFLGSYTVMMAPIISIMIYDYFFVRKGNYHIPSFYDSSPNGLFMYDNKFGINFRAFGAWCFGVGLTISGISNSLNPGSDGKASIHLYQLGFTLSFASSFVVYGILNKVFPVQDPLPSGMELRETRFEEFAQDDGYLEGESVETITGGDGLKTSVTEVLESASTDDYRVPEKQIDTRESVKSV